MFFFFKQKTAYEMCGRDWSSDVCSSDLTKAIGRNYFASWGDRFHFYVVDDPGTVKMAASTKRKAEDTEESENISKDVPDESDDFAGPALDEAAKPKKQKG